MKKITAFITFKEDSDVVKKGNSLTIELPNFKGYLPDYTEPNRVEIAKIWGQLADAECSVVFDFELPNVLNGNIEVNIDTEEYIKSEERRTMQFFNNREQRNINRY